MAVAKPNKKSSDKAAFLEAIFFISFLLIKDNFPVLIPYLAF